MDEKLKEIIGQLFMVGFEGTEINEDIKLMIEKYRIGNFILFSRNIDSLEQLIKLTDAMQRVARASGHKYPLSISIDQENGIVNRLGEALDLPGSMLLSASNNPQNAKIVAKLTANKLKKAGINWNLAPVVDVNNNSENPVIGVRSYGDDPKVVTRMGSAFVSGTQSLNVISTLKHFPGHGDTSVDSHLDMPVVNHDLNRMNDIELFPFKKIIEDETVDSIMISHIHFSEIDQNTKLPASLSENIIEGLLRHELNYEGVVLTDCLEMKAIADSIGTAKGALAALKAGNDIAMVSHTIDTQVASLNEVYKSVENNELLTDLIIEKYNRIIKLKEKRLLPTYKTYNIDEDIIDEIFRQGITKIGQQEVSDSESILFVQVTNESITVAEESKSDFSMIEKQISNLRIRSETVIVDDSDNSKLEKIIAENKQIVYILRYKILSEPFNQIINRSADFIIFVKDPYMHMDYSDKITKIFTYQPSPRAVRFGLEALFQYNYNNVLPVGI